MIKNVLKLVLVVVFMSLASCNEESVVENQTTTSVDKNPYLLEKIVTLNDGNYFVRYAVRANTYKEIDDALSLRPSIKVSKQEKELASSTFVDKLAGNKHDFVENKKKGKPIGVVGVILDSNIPKGYSLKISYEKPNSLAKVARRSRSAGSGIVFRSLSDKKATGVKVWNGPFDNVTIRFYSWGGGWWRYRGYRTIGPHIRRYHYFDARNYTSRKGVRVTADTRPLPWNELTIEFIY